MPGISSEIPGNPVSGWIEGANTEYPFNTAAGQPGRTFPPIFCFFRHRQPQGRVRPYIQTVKQILPGDEAAAALEQNPQYIVSPETSIQLLNEDAKPAALYLVENPQEMDYFYVLSDDVWNIKVTLDETVDPELAYFTDSHYMDHSLLAYQKEDGYYISFTPAEGDPVPGVMCQVCDAVTCQVFVSGPNGICTMTLPAGAYEIHTLKVPEGCEGDTTAITEAPAGGGEMRFLLTKN